MVLRRRVADTARGDDAFTASTELEKYVFEVDEYTTLDYDCADAF